MDHDAPTNGATFRDLSASPDAIDDATIRLIVAFARPKLDPYLTIAATAD